MRLLVMTGSTSSFAPPEGYDGLTRLAWTVAREFAALGHQVSFAAPRLRQEQALYKTFAATYQPPVPPGVLAEQDVVYLTDYPALDLCGDAVKRHSSILFVLEENAPWLSGPSLPNLRRIIYRSDRLAKIERGTAWLCDQVLVDDEIGPPLPDGGYVLWLGRLHLDKNPDAIVTFASMAGENEVWVAGPGQDAEPEWPRNVKRVSEVGGLQKAALLRSASALLYTVSPFWIGAGEGVLAEAAACGIPILAQSFSSGCPAHRCVIDGVNGFLHHDPGVLARLLPHALAMDRDQLHRRAWERLEPRAAALKRIDLISAALQRLHRDGAQ